MTGIPPDAAPTVTPRPVTQLPLMTPAQEQLKANPVTDIIAANNPQKPQLTQTPYGSGYSPQLLGATAPYGQNS